MFELEHCVENTLSCASIVNEIFKYFVTLLGENCIIDKCEAIDFLPKIFNKKSNIECKLIVYVLDNVVNSMKNKCIFYC